jgi:hypothetical protein
MVTIYCGLQLVLSKRIRIGNTKINMIFSVLPVAFASKSRCALRMTPALVLSRIVDMLVLEAWSMKSP